jgi:hypothetical protein
MASTVIAARRSFAAADDQPNNQGRDSTRRMGS